MRRPSFQFYPSDWSANPNLRRCTFAEKGIWVEVMCLMHDQDEYGVLRWPAAEIAEAVGCRLADLKALVRKGVLKGDDLQLADPFVYTPRSGRKDGDPVTLIDTQAGPIWYSSRMVRDEYVRTIRAEGGGNGESPKPAPKPPIGEANGAHQSRVRAPRAAPSSSSSASQLRGDTPLKPPAWSPPDWVPAEPWANFVLHRKAMRSVPFTDAARDGVVAELRKLADAGHDPGELLVTAVTRGWRTVFPPSGANGSHVGAVGKPAGKHAGFDEKDYRAGVTSDGFIA